MIRAREDNEPQQQGDVMPTLGQVAEEEDFSPLRELLATVMNRPVHQLGGALRGGLIEDAAAMGAVRLMQSFFDACDAAARAAERRTRARSGGGGDEGERERVCVACFSLAGVFFSVLLLFTVSLESPIKRKWV